MTALRTIVGHIVLRLLTIPARISGHYGDDL